MSIQLTNIKMITTTSAKNAAAATQHDTKKKSIHQPQTNDKLIVWKTNQFDNQTGVALKLHVK